MPCRPCAAVLVGDPSAVIEQLQTAPALVESTPFYLAWEVSLDGTASAQTATAVRNAGAVPWLRVQFAATRPLSQNLDALERELAALTSLASAAGPRGHFQVFWQGARLVDPEVARDYAFLLKRAAVAITGVQADASVITQPLAPELPLLESLYSEEIAAYIEAVALQPGPLEVMQQALAGLRELDPGKSVVLDAVPYPDPPARALAEAARRAVEGFDLVLFDAARLGSPAVAPLKLLAREFSGDLAFDPYSTPTGGAGVEAWSFVRGEDLGLRVIVEHGAGEAVVTFSDAQLRDPARIDTSSGEPLAMYGGQRSARGFELRWSPDEAVTILRAQRLTAAEIEGIAGLDEELTVVSERSLPVEEILRRLQAFEDAQRRRLSTYRALNTTHLRFQFGTEGIEATFEGELFFRRDLGTDWAWQTFFINGLRWKGRRLPEIPLIQPERAAEMPLDILLTRDYRYRLRGTAPIDGRDCWVVDFEPRSPGGGKSLYQGTVWIDRDLYARVRSRAVQLELEGDVISNEETITYSPVDAQGRPADWSPESFWLPLRAVSQQIWSLFNSATVVEKETLLSRLVINDPDFEDRRRELLASDVTMVRDTEAGLRYLVHDKSSDERVVKEGFDSNRLFFAGGTFYDESLDYPLPLAGVDFFSLDFRDSGSQLNVFFAGALLNASLADPDFLGSRFDAGVDLFAVGVRGTDTLFRDDREVPEEEVKQRQAGVTFNLGHRLGSYSKLDLSYSLRHTDYARSENTADDFLLPVDHLTQTLRLGASFSRGGYRLRLNGRFSQRSPWDPWGPAQSVENFEPSSETFTRWDAALSKTFHLSGFKKAGIELQWVDGQDLDRFSKYDLGFFSDVRVRGYESNRVRAESVAAMHASYGFEMGELFRLQFLADGAWASDETSGLDREFLAGAGVAGTVIGPWQTLIRLDLGAAVAGPDDGFTLFLAILKLYR